MKQSTRVVVPPSFIDLEGVALCLTDDPKVAVAYSAPFAASGLFSRADRQFVPMAVVEQQVLLFLNDCDELYNVVLSAVFGLAGDFLGFSIAPIK
jgi:hypothetical protein